MIAFTDLSIYWPEVVRFRERVASRYQPGVGADCVVVLPCSKHKPYISSRSHRLFAEAIGPARRRASVEELTITSPLGAVPRALETIPPASNYDIAVTGVWSHEEVEVVSSSLATVLSKHSPTEVIAHVSGGYLDACRRAEAALGWTFTYTGTGGPASKEGLEELSKALRGIDGQPRRRDPIELAKHVLSYQYGLNIAELMTLPPARRDVSARMERIVRDGKTLARRNPFTGFFTPEIEGARILADQGAYCVDIDFRPKVKVIYCPGVISADPAIRPDDEVVVRWKGQPVGQGRSLLNGREMAASDMGKAVVLREIFP